MRKVYFTESQLKGILGENFNSYLPKASYASESPEISYGTETTVTDFNDNQDPVDVVDTDKIGKSRTPAIPRYRRVCESKKKRLSEENQELVNHQYNLGRTVNQSIDNIASANPNDRLVQNMSNDKDMSYRTAKGRKHDLTQMKTEDPERFRRINGDKLLRNINSKLNNDTAMSKSHKETKRNMGYANAFQKAGGTKNNGGTAHSNKNGVTYTYYD